MKNILVILAIIIPVLISCNESESPKSSSLQRILAEDSNAGSEEAQSLSGNDLSESIQQTLDNYYQVADFSPYVFFHNDGDRVLINMNFFPEESDLCQQATFDETTNPKGCKEADTILIPCEYQTVSDSDFLSLSINEPLIEENCANKISVSIKGADYTLLNHLSFAFDKELKIFEEDFLFTIKRKSIKNSLLSQDLTQNTETFESIINEISDNKTEED